jgi:hypothetical protein
VDLNPDLVEMLARDRLDCATALAARRRLLRGAGAVLGATLP